MKKQFHFMKKNWKGAILGAIGSYILLLCIARIDSLSFLSVLFLPGTFLAEIIFKLLTLLNIIKTNGGFDSLATNILIISIINTMMFAVVGAIIQNNIIKGRKK